MSAPFFEIEPEKLDQFASEHSKTYSSADPFPHTVIDDFARPDVLDEVLAEFPDGSHPQWDHMNDVDQNKFACNDTRLMGTTTRRLIDTLNGRDMINFLTEVTGIDGLVADPHLAGGGLHEIRRGGMLRVHADFNYHEEIRLDRRINLLLYLNKDWKPEYGGQLELWDTDMKRAVKKIDPVFNRCVIFSTTDFSYHGHPDPLKCPEDRSRRSIAMYYYSNGRPTAEVSEGHGTLFQKRPGEGSAAEKRKDLVRSLVPPIVWDKLRDIRRNF